MPNHPINYIELSAQDPAASDKFYAQVFDWKIEAAPGMDYRMFTAEGGPSGGFVKPDGKMYKPGDVIVYIDTDDIDSTLKKIQAAGGKVLQPKTDIPGVGWFAFFADPGGNRIGLFHRQPH